MDHSAVKFYEQRSETPGQRATAGVSARKNQHPLYFSSGCSVRMFREARPLPRTIGRMIGETLGRNTLPQHFLSIPPHQHDRRTRVLFSGPTIHAVSIRDVKGDGEWEA